MNARKPKVLIIHRFLPHYRKQFYDLLRNELLTEGIELNLIYGKSANNNLRKKDEVDINWATHISNKVVNLFGFELYWQPCLKELGKHDLIIAEQASKLLINYLLIFSRKIKRTKFAFWGHGINRQINLNSFRNKFKKIYISQCDWWFAYTPDVKKLIEKSGFPSGKITIVQNSIDTKYLINKYNQIKDDKLDKIKKELSLGDGSVGLYCGGMYKEKRLDFLIEACNFIREKIPDFEMIFLGAGPDDYKVIDAAKTRKWFHYLGPKFDEHRVPYFKLADVFLMPGLVGLAILDCFAMQTPLITTSCPYHGPEIEYLENNENGLIAEDNIESYSGTVVKVLKNKEKLNKLKHGCSMSASEYNIENMVENFKSGIIRCLNNG